ncbi:hypothetical protein HMPREF1250_1667 [Megasphaera vaginalis (ex Srinivasan et al. 2021)]|uniref:Ribosome maturation factor RimP n=2 Tax=Megasphaera vaginalis (ex Srinivasan et al. 2021) TaxID=1111454 RepID=U7UCR3_9FIRM|nr:hypothetical protein HMPREF1250_1667 [Megasphaera vaginalis (ex Srinivasan et al. 2021)]
MVTVMKKEKVEEFVAREVTEIIAHTPLELVDVEYVRERDWYLRVFIDKEGGVDLEDCQKVSEQLSRVLDEKDPIKENYLLEVSSPGLDRILKRDSDFIRYQGRQVDVHFFKPYEGAKLLVAELVGRSTDRRITLRTASGERTIDQKDIAQIRLHIDF